MTNAARLVDQLETPVGRLCLVVTEAGALARLSWNIDAVLPPPELTRRVQDPFGITSRLAAYFAGDVNSLDDIRTDATGTEFQSAVWRALRTIPVGTTASYKQIAVQLGRPNAMRAVGGANHVNPIGIVVPCHRVIGGNGSLTGYAGGLERKSWLLAHEARHAPQRSGQQLRL